MKIVMRILIWGLALFLAGYVAYELFRPRGYDNLDDNDKQKKLSKRMIPSQSKLNRNEKFLYIYSRNCGFCQAFKPTAEKLQRLGLIPTEYTSEIGSMYSVRGVPDIIKVNHNQVLRRYHGNRSFASVRDFILNNE